MSRGLGKLQRAILDTLDDAKRECVKYRGFTDGRVIHRGVEFKLPDDVYDLRASSKYLSQKLGRLQPCPSFQTEGFQASFSRAVRKLIAAGQLAVLTTVPVIDPERRWTGGDADGVHRLADGDYIFATDRHVRFVRKCYD